MDRLRATVANMVRFMTWPIAEFRRGVGGSLTTLEIILGGFGLVAALVTAALLSPALGSLPGAAGDFAPHRRRNSPRPSRHRRRPQPTHRSGSVPPLHRRTNRRRHRSPSRVARPTQRDVRCDASHRRSRATLRNDEYPCGLRRRRHQRHHRRSPRRCRRLRIPPRRPAGAPLHPRRTPPRRRQQRPTQTPTRSPRIGNASPHPSRQQYSHPHHRRKLLESA